MPMNRAAVVVVHGLSKKPAPNELKRFWLWGLERDTPRPSIFSTPNRSVKLGTNGISSNFCYYADVFYCDDYELDFQFYYEKGTAYAQIAADGLVEIEAELPLSKSVTPCEQIFLHAFEAKLEANLDLSDPTDEIVIAGCQLPRRWCTRFPCDRGDHFQFATRQARVFR